MIHEVLSSLNFYILSLAVEQKHLPLFDFNGSHKPEQNMAQWFFWYVNHLIIWVLWPLDIRDKREYEQQMNQVFFKGSLEEQAIWLLHRVAVRSPAYYYSPAVQHMLNMSHT